VQIYTLGDYAFKGVYNSIQLEESSDIDYIKLKMVNSEMDFFIPAGTWACGDDAIYVSGLVSGRTLSYDTDGEYVDIEISKDSFISTDDLDNFLNKWNGKHFDFSIIQCDKIENIKVNKIKRVSNNKYYSVHNFVYEEDYYYEIELKNIIIKDEYILEELLNSKVFCLEALDKSVVVPNTALGTFDNSVKISKVSTQPYYGGLQNNNYYKAELKDSDFEWTGNRFKGKLKLIIRG
jgi:hypothetical protein